MFGPTFVYIFVGSPTNIYFDTKKKKLTINIGLICLISQLNPTHPDHVHIFFM